MIQISDNLRRYAELAQLVDERIQSQTLWCLRYAQYYVGSFTDGIVPSKPHYEELCSVLLKRLQDARELQILSEDSERSALLEVLA